MASRMCRALVGVTPALRAASRALTSAPLPASSVTVAPLAFGSLHVLAGGTRGFAALAGEMSESILATTSTAELTELLERGMEKLDPKSAGTALVRLAFLGANYPGSRDLQTRLEKVVPALAKHVPSMDETTKPLAKSAMEKFEAVGFKL